MKRFIRFNLKLLSKNLEKIIFLLIFLVPFVFWGTSLIYGHDSSPILNLSNQIKKDIYLWSEQFNGLMLTLNGLIDLIFLLLSRVFGLIIAQKIIYGLILALPFISFYYFGRELFFQKTDINITAKISLIIGGLFYALNYFVIQRWHELQWVQSINYGLVPLILYFYIKYLRNGQFKFAFASAFVMFLNMVNISDPPIIVGYFVLLAVLATIHIIFEKQQSISDLLKRVAVYIGYLALLSATAIFPLLLVSKDISSKNFVSANTGLDYVNLSGQQGSILGSLRQVGYFLLYSKDYSGAWFYDSIQSYLQSPYKLMAISIIILAAFLGILNIYKSKQKNSITFLSTVLIFGLLFANGTQKPTGAIFSWLFEHVPYFWIFRSADNKFLPLVLISLGLLNTSFLSNLKKPYLVYGSSLVLLFSILIYAKPLFSGEVPRSVHKIDISQDYKEVQEIINSDKLESASVLMNHKQYGFYNLNGHLYEGSNLLTSLLEKELIWNPADTYAYSSSAVIYQSLIFNSTEPIKQGNINFINAKYFIINKDSIASDEQNEPDVKFRGLNVGAYEEQLSDFELIKSNNSLSLYKLSEANFIPRIYIPNQINLLTEGGNLTDKIKETYKPGQVFVLNSDKNSLDLTKIKEKNASASVEFSEINPTKYRIILHQIKGVAPLVFTDSYNGSWQVKITDYAGISKNDLANQLPNLKIDSNQDSQAGKNEISKYIQNGSISILGNKSKTEFISKSNFGSIQNDNLKYLNENNADQNKQDGISHFVANGYANGWLLDIDQICKNENSCQKNPDGSYEIAFNLEYAPQHKYYLVLAFSALVLLGGYAYVIYCEIKNRTKRIKMIKNEN